MERAKRWAPWALLVVLLVGALAIGSRDGGSPTVAQRVHRIAKEVRCPTCEGLSVAESDAAASRAIRDDIAQRVRDGETDGQVRAFLVSRYGPTILLTPSGSGIGIVVWALPVAALVCAVGGLAVAFRRWRRRPDVSVTDEDRVLVERARRGL